MLLKWTLLFGFLKEVKKVYTTLMYDLASDLEAQRDFVVGA